MELKLKPNKITLTLSTISNSDGLPTTYQNDNWSTSKTNTHKTHRSAVLAYASRNASTMFNRGAREAGSEPAVQTQQQGLRQGGARRQ
jgi:hypothetical protein